MAAPLRRALQCAFVILLLTCARVAAAVEPPPPDDAPALGAEADARSRFVWRGVAWSRGPVVQPSAWGEALGWSVEAWCNFMVEREARSPSAFVASLAHRFAWRALRIEPAIVGYDMRARRTGTTAEASLELGLDLGDLELVTTHAVDVARDPRIYFGTVGARYERELDHFTLSAEASVGWASAALNRDYFQREHGAVDVVEAGVGARYELTDAVYVAVHAAASTLVARALRASSEPTLASAGASVGFEL